MNCVWYSYNVHECATHRALSANIHFCVIFLFFEGKSNRKMRSFKFMRTRPQFGSASSLVHSAQCTVHRHTNIYVWECMKRKNSALYSTRQTPFVCCCYYRIASKMKLKRDYVSLELYLSAIVCLSFWLSVGLCRRKRVRVWVRACVFEYESDNRACVNAQI